MRKNIKDYFWILLGSLLIAVGVNWFLVPHKIAAGGASGVGTILYVILGIPISVTALIINVSLLIVGYKNLSKSSIIKTLIGNGANAGAVVDKLNHDEIVGSVAGDDTLLVVCLDNESAEAVVEKITEFIK